VEEVHKMNLKFHLPPSQGGKEAKRIIMIKYPYPTLPRMGRTLLGLLRCGGDAEGKGGFKTMAIW